MISLVTVVAGLALGACAGTTAEPRSVELPPLAGASTASAVPEATAAATATAAPETAEPTTPAAAPVTESAAAPVVVRKTVTATQRIPYSTRRVNDPNLAKGTEKVRTAGVNGVRTVTYEVTYTDGTETARKVVRSVVTKQPVTRVVAVGTKTVKKCDPNYSGCVPIASDVDCAGGSGNGPAYVRGPVRVIGTDIYDLDRDGDGIACDG